MRHSIEARTLGLDGPCRAEGLSMMTCRSLMGYLPVDIGIRECSDDFEVSTCRCSRPISVTDFEQSGLLSHVVFSRESLSWTKTGSTPGGVRELFSRTMAYGLIGLSQGLFGRKDSLVLSIGRGPCSLKSCQAV
jgi:hypothetical protein